MAITVEALELNVQSSAESAATSVQGLISKLKELKETLGFNYKADFAGGLSKQISGAMETAGKTAAGKIKNHISNAVKQGFATSAQRFMAKHADFYNRPRLTKEEYQAKYGGPSIVAPEPADTSYGEIKQEIKEVTDATNNYAASTKKALTSLEATDNIASFYTELNKLESELDEASKKFNKFYNSYGPNDSRTVKAALALNKAREAVDQYRYDSIKKASHHFFSMEDTKSLIETQTETDRIKASIDELTVKINELQNAGADDTVINRHIEKVQKLTEKYEGLIAAEEAAKDAEIKKSLGIEDAPMFSMEDTEAIIHSQTELDRLSNTYMALKQQINDMQNAGVSQDKIDPYIKKAQSVLDKFKELKEAENAVSFTAGWDPNVFVGWADQLALLKQRALDARMALSDLLNDPNASLADKMSASVAVRKADAQVEEYQNLKRMLAEVSPEIQKTAQHMLDMGMSASAVRNKLFDLDGELKQKPKDAKNAAGGMRSFRDALSNTGTSIRGFIKDHTLLGKAFTKVGNVFGQFVRVAKMRAMRYAIRAMVQGLKEGIGNLYQWSKATKGSFSKSMDEASTAMLYMKNSIATAVAPLIQSLVPVFKTVVSWIHEGCNWLAQFFALLRGDSTWTRAVDYATEYAAATKKGSDNTKEMLAAFDELNVISSESGSGNSSSTNLDTSKMFETVDTFDKSIMPWVDKAKEALGWIKQTASDIWDIVWPAVQKLAPVFADAVSELMPIVKEAVEILTPIVEKVVNMAVDFIKQAWPTIKVALKWIGENLEWILPIVLEIKVGLAAWKVASGLLGSSGLGGVSDKLGGISNIASKLAGLGLITIGVQLGLEFGKDIVSSLNSGNGLSKESLMKGIGGAIASAIGGSLIVGGPYGWAIGLGVYIITNAIPVVEDILSKIHPIEEHPNYGEVADEIHMVDGKEEGAGVDWFIKTYDKLHEYANQTADVMKKLKEAADDANGTLYHSLTNLYDNINNEDLIPVIDSVGYEKSFEAIYDAAVRFGDDTTKVIKNWKFIAPVVNDENYSESLSMIRNLSSSTGADVETIMKKWEFIAPMVEKYGFDKSLGMIESLAITCGTSTKDIIGHWTYMAPAIDKYGFDKSLEIVTMLAIYSGEDIKNIIANWDMINFSYHLSDEEPFIYRDKPNGPEIERDIFRNGSADWIYDMLKAFGTKRTRGKVIGIRTVG